MKFTIHTLLVFVAPLGALKFATIKKVIPTGSYLPGPFYQVLVDASLKAGSSDLASISTGFPLTRQDS